MTTYGTSYYALKDRAAAARRRVACWCSARRAAWALRRPRSARRSARACIAAASSDAKLAVCRAEGADELINYGADDLRAASRRSPAARAWTWSTTRSAAAFSEKALRDMAWNGRFLVVGFATGDIPKVPLNLTLLKNCSIVGVFWLAFTKNERAASQRNNDELTRMFLAGEVKPHLHATYPLEQATDALNEVLHQRVSGKPVLVL